MRNKNVFKMKQPELGKLILDLRKQKGLTQEELVALCNLNVRTIQRIEAGEVSPRTYTIKSILEALGETPDEFFREPEQKSPLFNEKEKNGLFYSVVGTGVFAACFIAILIFEIFIANSTFAKFIFRSLIGVFTIVSVFYYVKGYKIIASKLNLVYLKNTATIFFGIEIIVSILSVFIAFIEESNTFLIILIMSILTIIYGIGELLLGINIQKLKTSFGDFAQIIGIAKVINGCCLITVILSPVSFIITIPILISEAIFLNKIVSK